jgi:hypothetical protein
VSESIVGQIQALRQMTVGQLRERWIELYGEPTGSRNRTYLWRRLAWRVQELQLGGLSDASKARMLELAPATFTRSQLPPGFRPESMVVPTSPGAISRRDPRLPAAGSTLLRRYKGQDVRVAVLDDGFEWGGRRFDSLSEVAFAVTGSKWNGWLFFGLTGRKRKA